jgi:hypothetical protein
MILFLSLFLPSFRFHHLHHHHHYHYHHFFLLQRLPQLDCLSFDNKLKMALILRQVNTLFIEVSLGTLQKDA